MNFNKPTAAAVWRAEGKGRRLKPSSGEEAAGPSSRGPFSKPEYNTMRASLHRVTVT